MSNCSLVYVRNYMYEISFNISNFNTSQFWKLFYVKVIKIEKSV